MAAVVLVPLLIIALGFRVTTAPNKRVIFTWGKLSAIKEPGLTWILIGVQSTTQVDCALLSQEQEVDVIARGGTPVRVKVGITLRVVDVKLYVLNVAGSLWTIVGNILKSEASGQLNDYSVDEMSRHKATIIENIEQALQRMSDAKGWGLGEFQITVGDPELSDDLKRAMMREEEVQRENKGDIAKAQNQIEVARILTEAARLYEGNPVALLLRKWQVLSELSSDSTIVVDTALSNDLATGLSIGKTDSGSR